MTNFNEMTVPELRALCKERGNITGYSRMRKAELIEVLEENVIVMAAGNADENSQTFETVVEDEGIRHVEVDGYNVSDFSTYRIPEPTIQMPENLNRRQRRMWMKRQKIKASNPHKNFRVAFS